MCFKQAPLKKGLITQSDSVVALSHVWLPCHKRMFLFLSFHKRKDVSVLVVHGTFGLFLQLRIPFSGHVLRPELLPELLRSKNVFEFEGGISSILTSYRLCTW